MTVVKWSQTLDSLKSQSLDDFRQNLFLFFESIASLFTFNIRQTSIIQMYVLIIMNFTNILRLIFRWSISICTYIYQIFAAYEIITATITECSNQNNA